MNHDRALPERPHSARAVLTDSHFWAPLLALLAGIALLVALH